MLTSEVMPAMARETKKRKPKAAPIGICEMTVGKAMKASPTPSVTTSPTATPLACAMKPRVAKTPMPARISKELLAKPATSAEPVRSERRPR
ncbi:hypothetical protein TPA0909_53420 [Streptomyces albus]|nr:hypothetical protein TPA0909_53420 [Streptomyces albus]